MPNTESEVIQIILKRGGKAKKGDIVKELGISLGYLDIITRSLERRGLVKFSNNIYFLTPSGKKKLAEFIQKTKKVKLKTKKKKGRPRKRGRPRIKRTLKKQKAEFKNDNKEPEVKLTEQTERSKKSPVETLLEQRIDELKEGMTEAEKKIEEGVKKIEEKIENELEKKTETVKEKVEPVVEKVEELPQIVLQFGKFLFSIGNRVFDKCKKVKNVKFPNKLISISPWIAKRYKNLTKKRN